LVNGTLPDKPKSAWFVPPNLGDRPNVIIEEDDDTEEESEQENRQNNVSSVISDEHLEQRQLIWSQLS
jgi:hypothetical protein